MFHSFFSQVAEPKAIFITNVRQRYSRFARVSKPDNFARRKNAESIRFFLFFFVSEYLYRIFHQISVNKLQDIPLRRYLVKKLVTIVHVHGRHRVGEQTSAS